MDFGTFLRARRLQVKLTPEALATRTHLDPLHLLRIEAAEAPPPDVQTLLTLVSALCLNLQDATTFLDLAHQASARPAAPNTTTARPTSDGALHKRLSTKATDASPPTRERQPGPATIVRGLRVTLATNPE